MLTDLIQSEIQELIEQRKFSELKEVLSEWHPADLAESIVNLPTDQQALIFRILPQNLAADVFEYLEVDAQKQLLRALAQEDVVKILNEMEPDDRTALLEELPPAAVTQLLRLLTPEERAAAQSLLGYPDDSVGRLMTPAFIAVKEDWTVQQVLDHIRQHGQDIETLNVVYVVDERGRLIDDVRIREFLLRPLDAKVADMRDKNFVALKVTDSEESAVEAFRKYDRNTLPVVDSNGVLVGIVTVDDVLDVAEEEATEDFHKGMAIQPFTTSLLKARLQQLYVRRISWLVLLVFVNIFSGAGIAHFEALIESVVALVFFLPLLIDSGGNAGSQAATLVIRSMALGEVRVQDYLKILFRELSVSFALGLTMAVAVFLLAWWRSGTDIAVVVAISMVAIVVISSLIGMSLPFIFTKLKMDPATASAPLVTSLADIAGVLIYLTIAQTLLGFVRQ
jgi:magnesium transporter